jgi:NitT/TauT family transport system substrate-binding protein
VFTSLASCVPPPAAAPSIRQVRLAMGYIPNVQFAPFYVAVEKGYFREEGIEITFDYSMEADIVMLVGAGDLSFAVASGDQVLPARAQGLPVVYAMTWWQDYPIAVVALKESGIQAPQDLAGKKIGIPMLSGASYVGYRAFLNAVNLTEDTVALDVIGFNQREALVSGRVDAAVVYANNEPVQLQSDGYETVVFRVADYVDLASNGLLTNEKTLQEDPALVRGMIRAILRGIDETVRDPDAAFEICRKYVEGLGENDAAQKNVLAATIEFWKTDQPGWSDRMAWQNMDSTLRSMGLLTAPLDVEKAFTNDFLP